MLGALRARTAQTMSRAAWQDAAAVSLGTAAVALLLFQTQRMFGLVPVVWPDETLFAQPAILFLHEGRLAAPLLAGAAEGVAERVYWYPPGYPVLLAGVFAVGGVSLSAIRAVSVVAAVVAVAMTWALARGSGAGRIAAGAAALLLAADPVFVRAALVGRPDTLVLALTVGALWLSRSPTTARAVLAGACASAAALTHLFGVIPLALIATEAMIARRPRAILVAVGAAPLLLAWVLYVLQDPAAFVDQFSLNLALHEREGGLELVLPTILDQYGDVSLAIVFAWSAGGLGLAVLSVREPRTRVVFAGFVLASFVTLSRQMWHGLYALPFAYTGFAVAIERLMRRPQASRTAAEMGRAFAFASLVAVLVALAVMDVEQIRFRAQIADQAERAAYHEWTSRIAAAIPTGSRVLIAGVPDPAFSLLTGRLQLIALQEDPRSLARFRDHLADFADYVLLAGTPTREQLALVHSRTTFELRVTTDAGRPVRNCKGWMPCAPFTAAIYSVNGSQ